MTKTNGFLALITMALLTACGVQEDEKGHDAPPSCGTDCNPTDAGSPDADAGHPSTDAGSDASTDAGNPAPDASTTPEPDAGPAGKCNADSDCATGMECVLGFCVPEGIVPPQVQPDASVPMTDASTNPQQTDAGTTPVEPKPECTMDSDCASTCVCSQNKCVAKPPVVNPPAPPADTTTPVISNIQITGTTETTVSLSWETSEPTVGDHVSYYRFDSDEVQLGFAVTDDNGRHHTFTVTALSPAKLYYFFITSVDAAGNVAESNLSTFKPYALAPFTFAENCDANGCTCSVMMEPQYSNTSPCAKAVFHTGTPGTPVNTSSATPLFMGKVNGKYVLTYSASAAYEGTYTFTYQGAQTCDSSNPGALAWASFGSTPTANDDGNLKPLSPDARSAIYCTWFADPNTTDPKCDGQASLDVYTNAQGKAACRFVPAGNMRNAY